jgi:hypothetical protein
MVIGDFAIGESLMNGGWGLTIPNRITDRPFRAEISRSEIADRQRFANQISPIADSL